MSRIRRGSSGAGKGENGETPRRNSNLSGGQEDDGEASIGSDILTTDDEDESTSRAEGSQSIASSMDGDRRGSTGREGSGGTGWTADFDSGDDSDASWDEEDGYDQEDDLKFYEQLVGMRQPSAEEEAAPPLESPPATERKKAPSPSKLGRNRSRRQSSELADGDSEDDDDCSQATDVLMPLEGVVPTVFVAPSNLDTGGGQSAGGPSPYVDQKLLNNITPFMAHHFAVEHRVFIRAVLDLLTERDVVGIQASLDDPTTIKAGVLKKKAASRSTLKSAWRPKYVEIRKGVLSYYNTDSESDHLGATPIAGTRKNVPLRASTCSVTSVPSKQHPSASPSRAGFFFELDVRGEGPKRVWMAASEKERSDWIAAIGKGTIGGSSAQDNDKQDEHELPADPPAKDKDMQLYQEVRAVVRLSKSREAYLMALSDLWGTFLVLPLHWMRFHSKIDKNMGGSTKALMPRRGSTLRPSSSKDEAGGGVSRLWKDLGEDTVSINGFTIPGKSGHGAERIVGALTRCILDFDARHPKNTVIHRISEIQAITFARDILVACARSVTSKDSETAVRLLCQSNPDLVSISRNENEALCIEVSNVNTASQNRNQRATEKSGWITTRASMKKPWKSRFCVLSANLLSYYEKEHPRPSGLREQLDLSGASLAVSEVTEGGTSTDADVQQQSIASTRYLISIANRDRSKERQLCFDDHKEMMEWQSALEQAFDAEPAGADDFSVGDDVSSMASSRRTQTRKRLAKGLNVLQGLGRTTNQDQGSEPRNPLQRSKGNGGTSVRTGIDTSGHDQNGMPTTDGPAVPSVLPATVQVRVQANAVYKLCTAKPTGDESKDVWGMVRTKYVQNFHLCGGSTGRLLSGEVVILLGFLKGAPFGEETFDLIFENEGS